MGAEKSFIFTIFLNLKLKEKVSNFFRKTLGQKAVFGAVLGVYVFAILFGFFGIGPKQAQAADYKPDNIAVKTETLVNGKPDNLIRVLKGRPINFAVTVTLLQPTDGLTVGVDRVDFRNLIAGNAVGIVKKFGVGIEGSGSFNKCTSVGNTGATNYVRCKFQGGSNALLSNGRVQVGTPLTTSFALDKDMQAKIGINQDASSAQVQKIRIYPYFDLEIDWASDKNVAYEGKEMYVQIFATQPELDEAIKNDVRPTGVPPYGPNTGTFIEGSMTGVLKIISDIFVGISQLFITLTYSVFFNLVSPMLEGVLSIHTYTDEFVNVIYPGWEVLRNVVNIYFIIAIIAIALGTLFRVESYKTKHLLVQLIIAALTVNFSLVIGQAILGVADTVQNQFLPNNVQVIRELGRDLMPNQIKDIIIQSKFAEGSFFATASASLFFLSLAFGSFVVFAAILIFLVIRIVMLWILLMLSPLAYAAGVLPATANLRGQWWGNFLKYAFFTPIMAFFLNMAAIIAVNYEYVFRDINRDIASTAKWGGFATLVFAVASNVLLLVFLFAAVSIAQRMGIIGASTVENIFKKGLFAPFVGAGAVVGLGGKGAKKLVGFGLEKLHEKTGWELRPKEWVEGWKHSREENIAKRKALGKGVAIDKGLPFGNPTAFFQRYWNPHTLSRIAQGGDRKGRRLLAEAEKEKEEYLKKKENGSFANEEERLNMLDSYTKKMDMARRLMAPVDYHSQKEIRGKQNEEKGKVHSKNWHELFSLFEAAKHEHEPLRAGGIFLRVTETFNENEFINSSVYHRNMQAHESAEWTDPEVRNELIKKKMDEGMSKEEAEKGDWVIHNKGEHFVYSVHGADNFRKMVLEEELGMGEETSKQLMNDVSDMCEDTNHRVLMRMYGERGGKLYLKTKKEREPEVRAENNKLNAERMINLCNRLVGFIEIPSDDYEITGERYSQITAAQLAYYIEHPSDIEPLVRRGRINSSQAKSFSENYEEILAAGAQILDNTRHDQEDPARPELGNTHTKYELFAKAMKIMKEKGEALIVDESGDDTIDKTRKIMPSVIENIERKRREGNVRPTT